MGEATGRGLSGKVVSGAVRGMGRPREAVGTGDGGGGVE